MLTDLFSEHQNQCSYVWPRVLLHIWTLIKSFWLLCWIFLKKTEHQSSCYLLATNGDTVAVFFVNRFSELQKKSLMSDWRTHLPSFRLHLQKGPHRMITFYVQCHYIPVFSCTRSCSAEGCMWFLLPELLLLLKVLCLLMSCMVTHLLNRTDLHFTSLEHT